MLFSVSEFVVLPYKEIYQSGVLLMAMSNNIPVVVSNLSPFVEVLGDDFPFMFISEDSESLVEKIEFAVKNKKLLNDSANKNLLIMENSYSWEEIGKQYVRVISELK